MQTVKLSNEVEMPVVGLGVYQMENIVQCEQAILDAFHAGYRMIDTAENYMNEEAVGSAFHKSSLNREDVFITSKIWINHFGKER